MWEERTLQVGGTLCGARWLNFPGSRKCHSQPLIAARNLGAAAQDLLADALSPSQLTIAQLAAAFCEIARVSGPAPKRTLVEDLLRRSTALEAKYVIKIISGDLRIGLRESLVEEAIAVAFTTESAGSEPLKFSAPTCSSAT